MNGVLSPLHLQARCPSTGHELFFIENSHELLDSSEAGLPHCKAGVESPHRREEGTASKQQRDIASHIVNLRPDAIQPVPVLGHDPIHLGKAGSTMNMGVPERREP